MSRRKKNKEARKLKNKNNERANETICRRYCNEKSRTRNTNGTRQTQYQALPEKALYTKQYGYDESIATGPITVTVGDVCHRMEKMANDYAEKITKYNEKAAGYRAEKITDETAAFAYKRKLLEQKTVADAEKGESRIAINNWNTYTRYQKLQKEIAALQQAATPESQKQLRDLIMKRNTLVENGRLILKINFNGKQETISYRINRLERTTALDQFNPNWKSTQCSPRKMGA